MIPLDASAVYLCATQRLARHLQLRHGRAAADAGQQVWPTLRALTFDAWLADSGEAIALSGAVPADEVPARVLSAYQAALVWRQVLDGEANLDLFNRHSLAETAAEADALAIGWRLRLDADSGVEETQHFRAWRRMYADLCRRKGWLDAARYRERVLDWLERGHGVLPSTVVLAGFDTLPPAVRRLREILSARGVAVHAHELPQADPAVCVQRAADAEAECRAAALWARARLQANPAARLGIVVADLDSRRALLTPQLDAALPAAYNISLGLPLARQEIVATALVLLGALAQPGGLPPAEFGALLRRPYWSADLTEAGLRARLDARLRERPGQTMAWGTGVRLALGLAGDTYPRLAQHLRQLTELHGEMRGPARPGAWARRFHAALAALGWPGERTLSSTEFQARAAFLELLDGFARLDDLLCPLSVGAAVAEVRRLSADILFQPKTEREPPVQVLGMLEATGAQFDALWVMGMNDELWPPPARPNPLLPAELQRRHGTPASSAEEQARFACAIQVDLLQAAPDVVFSFAAKEGDCELRMSPLVAVYPFAGDVALPAEALPPARFERLDDALAPPVAADETVAGGSSLLRAQALCPAWAFYRYRLGAKALQAPAEGLDAATRGQLVHGTLEHFWREVQDLAGLHAQGSAALAAAVEQALRDLEETLGEPLGPTLRALEAQRLRQLCGEWLRFEGEGRMGFAVAACEERHQLTLGRLTIHLVIDRIDVLVADGRRIVLDYKTGGKLDVKQWARERIGEPQLPLYAALVLAEQDRGEVAAVAFARVRRGECAFAGVAAAEGLLPGVETRDNWQALIGEWKEKLLALAAEIEGGEAAVRFEHDRDLAFCEVKPLLRLAERRRQFEARHE